MNVLKIQQELLKTFFSEGKTVHYFDYDDDNVFVTTTKTNGYVIPRQLLRVDLREAQVMMDVDLRAVFELGAPLIPTDEYRIGGTVRKFLTLKDEEVYIDTGLLKNFDTPQIFRSEHKPHYLVVVEDLYNNGSAYIVGLVLPFKMPN